ncbi:OmpP1/FadL family transporter [Paracidovorax oryzae]|uniref:OmpP1/FadL family transporter n=1 Tax=Paracidovorax oryzae TaxID=862720 RepID=UPI00047E8A31|nr:outer membrane protein transport protein [Paracidovorax oryzae]
MKLNKITPISLAIIFSGTMASAFAETGTNATGYGSREQGMGGVGIAVGESALAPATNPAGIAFAGERLDIGSGIYFIRAGSEFQGQDYKTKLGLAVLPEFGYIKDLSPAIAVGVASWSGGAGVTYREAFGGVRGNSQTRAQTVFLHVAPTIAYRFGEHNRNALSVALVGAVSTISVKGVEAQTGQSNRGRDWSQGYGVRLGWMSRFTDQFSAGAFYASKVRYGAWDRYSQILADGARFEEPESYGVGVAFRPNTKWLIGLDWNRFNYAKTRSLGNPLNLTVPLGSENGSGFGFRNIDAYRFGVQYEFSDRWIIRGGFEVANQLLTPANTAFTFLVPLTPNRTYTLGGTYRMSRTEEVSFAYALSPRVQVVGSGPSQGTNPYGLAHYAALTYTRKFK